MTTLRGYSALAPCVAILALACGHIEDPDGLQQHNCDRAYNSAWGAANYRVEHWEPRLCPVAVEPSGYFSTGGTVFEVSSVFPNNVTAWGDVTVFDEYNVSSWWGAFELASTFLSFYWGPSCSGCSGQKWQSSFMLEYPRGTNPDFVEISVEQWGGGATPKALLWIHYSG